MEAAANAAAKGGGKGIAKGIAKGVGGSVIGAAGTAVAAYLTYKKADQLFDDGLHALGDLRDGFVDIFIDPWLRPILQSMGWSDEKIDKFEKPLGTGILVAGGVFVVYEIKK